MSLILALFNLKKLKPFCDLVFVFFGYSTFNSFLENVFPFQKGNATFRAGGSF
jgi:hypothetical protein